MINASETQHSIFFGSLLYNFNFDKALYFS